MCFVALEKTCCVEKGTGEPLKGHILFNIDLFLVCLSSVSTFLMNLDFDFDLMQINSLTRH